MKVLYLSYDGMTDPLGQSQVLPYLLGLSKLGHTIHLISFEKEVPFKAQQDIIHTLLASSTIVWHPQSYTKKPPVLSTLKDLWLLKKKCTELHKHYKFELFHCRSYLTSLIALSFWKKNKVPFLFDMRGFWADERVEGSIWNLKNPLYRIIYNYFKSKEIQFLNQSAKVISLTRAAKKEIETWPKFHKSVFDKITVIPCCADLEHFTIRNSTHKQEIRQAMGIAQNKLVISYVGSLGTWYMAAEMLLLFAKIKQSYAHALLLIITTHAATEVETFLKVAGISLTDVVIRSGKRSEMPDLISASDVSMFFVRPTFSKKASSPTKMGEIMGCGIPVICNAGVGDVESIVQESQCGICISDFSEASMQQVIGQLPQLLKLEPLQIRKEAQKYYALKEGVLRYNEVYDYIHSKN